MNHTQNYQLSQWAKSDKVLMEDFNADNAKIDAALKAETTARTALAATVAQKGNCSIGFSSYTGTGTYGPDHPTQISFPRRPAFFLAFSDKGFLFARGNDNRVMVQSSTSTGTVTSSYLNTTWSGNTCSFYDSEDRYQVNSAYTTYHVIAFYAES